MLFHSHLVNININGTRKQRIYLLTFLGYKQTLERTKYKHLS